MKNKILMTLMVATALPLGMVALAGSAIAQQEGKAIEGKVSMDVLASLSFMQDPEMSPDGTKVAVAIGAGNSLTYGIIDLSKPGSKPEFFAQSETFKDGGDREIVGWEWLGNDYLLIQLQSRDIIFGQRVDLSRLVSYNLKTKKLTPLAWEGASASAARILHSDAENGEILLQRQSQKYGSERAFRPEVVRVDVKTGKIIKTEMMPNPIVTG